MKNVTAAKRNRNTRFFVSAILITGFALYATDTNAQQTKKWIAPATANQLKNPVAGDGNVLKDAKKLYVTYCAPCHGNTGKGNGIASASINPKPADHTSASVQSESDGSLYWKLTEGRAPMPSYKQALPDIQRWELVNYIRSLAKSK